MGFNMDQRRAGYFDTAARKKTVSLTINSDLEQRARAAKINLSQVAEQAVAMKLEEITKVALEAAARMDLLAYNEFIEKHGLFADHLREYEGSAD
jgi:antitoxin CcdA